MRRLLLLSLVPVALAAAAQPMDHSAMPGMMMPGDEKQAKKPPKKSAPAAHPGQAKKRVPSSAASAPAAMDHSAMPGMKMPSGQQDHSSMPGMKMPSGQQDHSSMPGMNMPSSQQDHSSMPGMKMPSGQQDHSSMPGMKMPAAQAPAQDHSSMPGMNMNGAPGHDMAGMGQMEIPHTPPPPPPSDRAADRFFSPTAMATARAELQHEHGGETVSMVMANLAEYQVRNGSDGYRWDGEAWYGGDIHRFVLKSEGEGTANQGVETAELQALYSRAVGVYTDLQFGARQDFEPHSRTYATIGFESLLPYWLEVQGAAFLSHKGELLARFEGTYDLLLTNYLILQPRAELNFSAQDIPEMNISSGLSNAELGLRLRYEVTREFSPYIGVSWNRQIGHYSRAFGGGIEDVSLVLGIRTFF